MSAINPDKVQFFTKHPFSVTFSGKAIDLKISDVVWIVFAAIAGLALAAVGSVFAFFAVSYVLRKRVIKELSQQDRSADPRISTAHRLSQDVLNARRSSTEEAPLATTPPPADGRMVIANPRISTADRLSQDVLNARRSSIEEAPLVTTPPPADGRMVINAILATLDGRMASYITMNQKKGIAYLVNRILLSQNPRESFIQRINQLYELDTTKGQYIIQNLAPLIPEQRQDEYVSRRPSDGELFPETAGLPTQGKTRFAKQMLDRGMGAYLSIYEYNALIGIYDFIKRTDDATNTQYQRFSNDLTAIMMGPSGRLSTASNGRAILQYTLRHLGECFEGHP